MEGRAGGQGMWWGNWLGGGGETSGLVRQFAWGGGQPGWADWQSLGLKGQGGGALCNACGSDSIGLMFLLLVQFARNFLDSSIDWLF